MKNRTTIECVNPVSNSLCFGVHWGAISHNDLFGETNEFVDLDGGCIAFDKKDRYLFMVYFGNLEEKGIKHSGDDLVGDEWIDNEADNETICINLSELEPKVKKLFFVLNSYKGHKLTSIPFIRLRVYQGDFNQVDKVLAQFDVENNSKFSGATSVIMGRLCRKPDGWKFVAIGEPTRDRHIRDIITTIKKRFLN